MMPNAHGTEPGKVAPEADKKRIETLKAKAAFFGLELLACIDAPCAWSVSNWYFSRTFENLNEVESFLIYRKGNQ